MANNKENLIEIYNKYCDSMTLNLFNKLQSKGIEFGKDTYIVPYVQKYAAVFEFNTKVGDKLISNGFEISYRKSFITEEFEWTINMPSSGTLNPEHERYIVGINMIYNAAAIMKNWSVVIEELEHTRRMVLDAQNTLNSILN